MSGPIFNAYMHLILRFDRTIRCLTWKNLTPPPSLDNRVAQIVQWHQLIRVYVPTHNSQKVQEMAEARAILSSTLQVNYHPGLAKRCPNEHSAALYNLSKHLVFAQ